jgi:UDP-N-acetylglucosamine--N-acetylmuramyl-(pentapeptide) pyrophosphoryl-undecaprenol N-acetylglucosamine transferase
VGGSQGSHSLNQLWKEAVTHFNDEEKRKIAVIHITGEKDFEAIKSMYPAQGIEARVFGFHDRMEEIYPEADLAITRSGAGTLFELALFGIPSLIFPYPHADAHQEVNARYFAAQGGIVQLCEKDCTPVQLKEQVFELVNSERLRNLLSERIKRLALPDASERLVEVAEELLRIRSGDFKKREEGLAGRRRP